MGMNYYTRTNICTHCNRYDEKHIGKSSFGWCFALHVIPEENINSLDDWKTLFNQEGLAIYNEDGRLISVTEMLETITNRSRLTRDNFSEQNNVPFPYKSWFDFYHENYAEPGPNGLVRHKIMHGFCIGHGDGPWDLITGEFS